MVRNLRPTGSSSSFYFLLFLAFLARFFFLSTDGGIKYSLFLISVKSLSFRHIWRNRLINPSKRSFSFLTTSFISLSPPSLRLTRMLWPTQLPSTEYVDVEMEDGLPDISAGVYDRSVSITHTHLLGYPRDGKH